MTGEESCRGVTLHNDCLFLCLSLSTVLCLEWEPQAIAVAFLYLAGKLAKYDLQSIMQSKSQSWWRQFVDNLDVQDLDSKGQLLVKTGSGKLS